MLNLLTLYGMFYLSNCVAMQPGLRRHVSPAASGRNLGYVVTQFLGHRAHSNLLCGLAGG